MSLEMLALHESLVHFTDKHRDAPGAKEQILRRRITTRSQRLGQSSATQPVHHVSLLSVWVFVYLSDILWTR